MSIDANYHLHTSTKVIHRLTCAAISRNNILLRTCNQLVSMLRPAIACPATQVLKSKMTHRSDRCHAGDRARIPIASKVAHTQMKSMDYLYDHFDCKH